MNAWTGESAVTFPKEFLQAVELYQKLCDGNLSAEEREKARRECTALLDYLSVEIVTEKDEVQ